MIARISLQYCITTPTLPVPSTEITMYRCLSIIPLVAAQKLKTVRELRSILSTVWCGEECHHASTSIDSFARRNRIVWVRCHTTDKISMCWVQRPIAHLQRISLRLKSTWRNTQAMDWSHKFHHDRVSQDNKTGGISGRHSMKLTMSETKAKFAY